MKKSKSAAATPSPDPLPHPPRTTGETAGAADVETSARPASSREGGILPDSSQEIFLELSEREGIATGDTTVATGRDFSREDGPSQLPQLSQILEAILFASQKAVSPKELVAHFKNSAAAAPESPAAAFGRIKESDIRNALEQLRNEVATMGRAYEVRESASGWQLCSAAAFAPWLRQLYPEARPSRLSAPALETLAIIAYRQPIARADIEAVRGVAVDGVMQTILDRGLVKIAGRAEVPGRPLLYATTQFFLDHFGLRSLDELPNTAELRHVPLPRATPEPSLSEAEQQTERALEEGAPESSDEINDTKEVTQDEEREGEKAPVE